MKKEGRETIASRLWHAVKIILTGLTIMGILALMLFTVLYGEHGYRAIQQSMEEERRLIEAVKAGKQRNQEMEQEIRRLQDDPQLIEKIAREELGMAKPKDIVIRIAEPPSATAESETTHR